MSLSLAYVMSMLTSGRKVIANAAQDTSQHCPATYGNGMVRHVANCGGVSRGQHQQTRPLPAPELSLNPIPYDGAVYVSGVDGASDSENTQGSWAWRSS